MDKKRLIALVVLIFLVIIILSYPSFFFLEPFGKSGGFAGFPIDRVCECSGLQYDYYPSGCNDCATQYYCFGKTSNCRCLNESKVEKLSEELPEGFQNVNKKYDTYQELLDNAYDHCP